MSLYFAKVSDNKDSNKLNRIKVTCQKENDSVTSWIPYVSPLAGNGTGLSALPDVGTQIAVISIDTCQNLQVAIGSSWSENSKPPETKENSNADFNKDGNNSLHFIKSKSGNLLIFDDTNGAEKIQLIAAGGKTRIEFSKKDKLLNIETDQNISFSAKKELTFEAEEISINSKNKINLSCDEFQCKSSKECTIKSDQDISIKGSSISLN